MQARRVVKVGSVYILAVLVAAVAGVAWAEEALGEVPMTAAGNSAEGELAPFLGEPQYELQELFDGQRFPNVVVGVEGVVIATWGREEYLVRRSEDGGETWGPEMRLAESTWLHGGSVTVDERSGAIFVFVVEEEEERRDPIVLRSTDEGETWEEQETDFHPDPYGNLPLFHMNETGVTLRHSEYAGRLLAPISSSVGSGGYRYTQAIYSDDGGESWRGSGPFPVEGTLEGALAELSDGRIYYNSRRNRGPKPGEEGVLVRPREIDEEDIQPEHIMRHTAWSYDGGETWTDLSVSDVLYDGGGNHTGHGCMAGLVRLPVEGRDILLFSNPDTEGIGRHSMTVWASFDGGETWPVKRLVYEGPSAYSSLAAGRPETPSEGWVYLFFEGGAEDMYGGGKMARFNLGWLLEGELTGDGEIPDFAEQE